MILNSAHRAYMALALQEAQKAIKKGEVPVGAVIVNDQGIVAKAHNNVETKKNACYHAEILAINSACKALNSKFLDECMLYVTLEPCCMCIQAIYTSRIKKLFFGASITPYTKGLIDNSPKMLEVYEGLLEKESQMLLTSFFTSLRNKKTTL
ncbi:CMP deaminase [Candidatus Phycorickettsia trachydisci]|uniref:CMP deaminase n=1 Tax=Candidatus Phycorickettsia trachydisci TaxID=2115978 RepID=A0A2P1P9E9_9RICK|nr:nucleoside deaminase [Candidatus Phycorickettsia trachydisci]AVP87887.1 CMP deaminase [Candidatus Phycorickettsia trachydisci]